MESDLSADRTRRHIMCAAKGGEEIVEHIFVGQIDHLDLGAPQISIAVKNVVMADGHVEEVSGRDARRVMVGILGAGRGYLNQGRAELRGETNRRQRSERSRMNPGAGETGLELLVGRQAGENDGRLAVKKGRLRTGILRSHTEAGHRTRH